jgi:hypothetical protein
LGVYLLIMLATAGVIIGLAGGVDITFLRLLVAVFVAAGFTIAAVILTRVSFEAVAGRPPSIALLGAGLLGGLAIWIPATWTLGITQQILIVVFGSLSATVGSSATIIGQGVVFGLILPICQGLFFFGYLQASARGLGRWRGVWLVALLYGLYGLMSAGLGLSAVPGYFLVGLVAAALTERTQSMLVGIAALCGFFLGDPVLRDLVYSLGTQDTLTVGWLTAVTLSLFIAYLVVQATRLFMAQVSAVAIASPGRGWWFPLILVAVIVAVISYGEVITRGRAPFNRPAISSTTGSTAPPSAPTPLPGPSTPGTAGQ